MAKSTFKTLFILLAIMLLVLPLVTTFNEVLTTIIMKIKIYRLIQSYIVPIEAKFVTTVLHLFGMPAFPTITSVNFGGITTIGNNITISWNCIGWQSFILLVITFATGLQGDFHLLGKIQTIIIGVLGTFLINIFRISLVAIIAYRISPLLAVIFHDYFSTFFIIVWLFFFWWFCYTYVLEPTGEESKVG
ncbi:MAG: exosortase/archaeosortase family protein [Candidatus Gottesmanbacteria bacterium]